MAHDEGYQRFFSYIALFTFSMLMLVMSNNFLQLFFGWEAVGLVSYLLIGFYFKRESAIFANLKAFLVNRVGDFGFILGIAAIAMYANSLDYAEVFAAAPGLKDTQVQIWGDTSWSLMTVICILLGMGMPTTGIYLLVATLAAPPLIELGVDPMAAHLFILYFGLMSMISPPVAVAAFAAASIARAAPMQTALQAVRIGWPAFTIPFLFVFSPSLLLRDELFYSVTATATALFGVWLVSAGTVGFLRRHLCFWERGLFALAGFCLLIPSNAFAGAAWIEAAGGLLAIGGLSMQYLMVRTAKAGGPFGKP
jgi:hypothetical protein